ncbi:MAG: hypothetical protein ACR2M4_05310 [Actinomycetota bacterium]
MVRPIEVEGQRASALRFGDGRVQALFSVLVLFSLQARGFTNYTRALLAQLLGLDPAHYSLGRMRYDLRRLRLHGLIERIPHSHRYVPTTFGLRVALFFLPHLCPALATDPRRYRSQCANPGTAASKTPSIMAQWKCRLALSVEADVAWGSKRFSRRAA